MFSKILIKLVDQAIIPAILLLVTRVVSVVLVSRYFMINYSINSAGFVFPNQEDYIRVNSYSLFIMLFTLTLGIGFVVLKSYVFHDTHITPKLTAKLFSLRLSSFIQTSFDIYSQGIVWLSYVYLMFFVIGAMSLFGLVYSWVFILSFTLTLLSTIAFVLDIENEMHIEDEVYDEFLENSEYVLKFGDVNEH